MSSQEPSPIKNSASTGKTIFEKLSLAGKLMCGGAVLALVSAFLALFSVRMTIDNPILKMGAAHQSGSSMVIEDWRRVTAVLACVGCGIMALMLFGATPHPQAKNMTLGVLIAGGLALLMSILIWVSISRSSSGFSGLGAEMSAGAGIGAYLILIASIVCLAGSLLHAKDAKLF